MRPMGELAEFGKRWNVCSGNQGLSRCLLNAPLGSKVAHLPSAGLCTVQAMQGYYKLQHMC